MGAQASLDRTGNFALAFLLAADGGDRIRGEVLGSARAGDGEQIVATLSHRLAPEFAPRGFERTNLPRMMKLAEVIPEKIVARAADERPSFGQFRVAVLNGVAAKSSKTQLCPGEAQFRDTCKKVSPARPYGIPDQFARAARHRCWYERYRHMFSVSIVEATAVVAATALSTVRLKVEHQWVLSRSDSPAPPWISLSLG
jgi:hypothetical protein